MTGELFAKASGGGWAPQTDLRGHVLRVLESRGRERDELMFFLRKAGPREWLTLDDSMRSEGYGAPPSSASGLGALVRGVLRSAAGASKDVLDIGVASMGRDGRVRESAVRDLDFVIDPLANPFLALRSVDWVDQVAKAAISILASRLATDTASVLAAAPLLFSLVDRQRSSGLTELVLERAAADSAVRSGLLALSDRRTRRRVIADPAIQAATPLNELVALAVSDTDSAVASAAGVAAVARLSADDGDVLEQLLAGPALVRHAVLEALPDGDRARDTAIPHLFDRSPTVRTAAQRTLVRTGGDPAAVYRSALAAEERRSVAILELAAVGGTEDHPTIIGALQSADVSTRRAAVKATGWIAGGRVIELLSPMLWDESSGVTRAAERRLRSLAQRLDGARLFELAGANGTHNRRAAYRLLRRRGAPDRLEADLLGVADPDPANQKSALGDLRSWIHRGAASAPRADLATRRRLGDRLDRVESTVGHRMADQVRFHAGLRPADFRG